MSRNGSGTYNLPAGNPVVTGNTISSSWANTTLSDIASALTGSIAADGQTTPTANLVMGTYAHTGVGNATARTMYASAGQVQDSVLTYLTSVAGTNAITASAPIVMTAYATGQTFRFIAAGANTGATTININSIGLKSITRDGTTALVAGDLVSGGAYQLIYDGTQFQLTNSSNASVQVTSFSAGTTGLTPSTATTGAITLGGTLGVANGGTGLTSLTAGYIPYGNGTGALSSSANLTFSGSSLGVIGSAIVTGGSATVQARLNGSDTFAGGPTIGLTNTAANRIWFTQLSASNNYDWWYFNGSAASKLATLDSSGNLGLGVTPSAWRTVTKAFQIGSQGYISGNTANQAVNIGVNKYINSSGQETYITSDYASYYQQYQGSHTWLSAPSGTAGTAITFTQAMTLDASGNLGIGNTSPAYKLDVAGDGQFTKTSADSRVVCTASGVANTVVGFNNSGSTNFVGAVNNTSYLGNAQAYPLVFTVNTVERARLNSGGNLLVGITAAQLDSASRMVVLNTSGTVAEFTASSGTATQAVLRSWNTATSGDNLFQTFHTDAGATQRGSITYNRAGGLLAYNVTSDYRAKTVNGSVQNALSKVALLKPSAGRMNGATEDIDFFVAHELQEVVPSAVTGEKDATREEEYEISPAIPAVLDEEGNEVTPAVEAVMGTRTVPVYQMVDKSALIPLLTAALQEAHGLIKDLQVRVEALEAK